MATLREFTPDKGALRRLLATRRPLVQPTEPFQHAEQPAEQPAEEVAKEPAEQVAKELAEYVKGSAALKMLDLQHSDDMGEEGREAVREAAEGREGFELKLPPLPPFAQADIQERLRKLRQPPPALPPAGADPPASLATALTRVLEECAVGAPERLAAATDAALQLVRSASATDSELAAAATTLLASAPTISAATRFEVVRENGGLYQVWEIQ